MADDELTVDDGVVVSLDYTLRDDEGEVLDSSEGEAPLEFLQGQGHIVSGLERELYGMSVGEEKDVTVDPGDGYGEIDPDALQLVSLDAFPGDVTLEPGMGLQVRDQTGEVYQTHVAEIRPDGVVLNFNHPLAGQTLYFNVKIAGLREATTEELEHGHIHGEGEEHDAE